MVRTAEELFEKQRKDYEQGKYLLPRMPPNHGEPYFPYIERRDSKAIREADTGSLLLTFKIPKPRQ